MIYTLFKKIKISKIISNYLAYTVISISRFNELDLVNTINVRVFLLRRIFFFTILIIDTQTIHFLLWILMSTYHSKLQTKMSYLYKQNPPTILFLFFDDYWSNKYN